MLRQTSTEFTIVTRGRRLYEVTDEVAAWVARSGVRVGLLTLHVRHTSASLLIQENADPDVRADLEYIMKKLAPDGDPGYRHQDEGPDDMSAHIRSILTGNSLTIPFNHGRLLLGTWQGVYLWEHRTHAHSRNLTLTVYGE